MHEVSQLGSNVSHTGGWQGFLTIGFSTRALAQAVVRAGYKVAAMDHFLDQDLAELGPCASISWPGIGQSRTFNPDEVARNAQKVLGKLGLPSRVAVLAAGGLETWPGLWEAAAREAPFLGPSIAQIEMLRSPDFLRQIAEKTEGIHFPEVQSELRRPQIGWLEKSLKGSGGLGVFHAEGIRASSGHYLQKRVSGHSIGACLAVNDQHIQLMGCTESWTQEDWPGPLPFIYRGSWGPIPLQPRQRRSLLCLAEKIQRATQLKGWLQLDLILDELGELWLLEVNPRWSAGMEILDEAGRDPVNAHLQCFQVADVEKCDAPRHVDLRGQDGHLFAKAVVYAPREWKIDQDQLVKLRFAESFGEYLQEGMVIADVPSKTLENVEAGHPLLTLKASTPHTDGTSHSIMRQRLLTKLQTGRSVVQSQLFDGESVG